MPETSKIEILIAEVEENLARFKREYRGLTWRQKVLLLVEVTGGVRKLGKSTNPAAARLGSRDRLKIYFQEHIGIVLSAKELQVVSGISDYARRIRELRVQDGYKIITGYSKDPESGISLKPTEYLLLDINPDVTAARRWHIANRIRKQAKGGSRGRILRYLLENVDQVVTTEELAYVAKKREFGRRTRELRTEEGYLVATHFTGRPDLRMGEYILENKDRIAEPHDRHIPFKVQKEVYKRDSNRCRLCKWHREEWTRRDPRILELHHIQEHAKGGANIARNLIVLCSKCHDKVHSGKLKLLENILD
ncbi:MAG: HNH endonuclease [Sedimentisphaerales bacterium]|nr:HNH endonuclease [Sedimentisphaerales bacterium]